MVSDLEHAPHFEPSESLVQVLSITRDLWIGSFSGNPPPYALESRRKRTRNSSRLALAALISRTVQS